VYDNFLNVQKASQVPLFKYFWSIFGPKSGFEEKNCKKKVAWPLSN